jgi:AraC family transcriptional regulator
MAPSSVKSEGVSIKAFPPISFKITIKGAEEMEYRIEKKEGFRILGISAPLKQNIEENFSTVPNLWQNATMDGTISRLASLMEGDPMGLLGVSACNEEESWKYFIAVANNSLENDEFEKYDVPSATWAIFSGEGTGKSVQDLEKRIITEWLPTSGYEYGNAPDIEVYLNADPQNAKYEVWIPVLKR